MTSKEKPFSNLSEELILQSTEYFSIVEDKYPVSPNHLLIISNRPVADYFELNKAEKEDLINAIDLAKSHIESISKPDGYNLGMNCGSAAGQTIFHFHLHVIPRFIGDMENPRGGVRHCVEGKGDY